MGGPVPADDNFAVVFLGALALGLVVFVVPIFIAFWRRHPNRWLILVVTIAFGATLVGWLVALIWALNWEDLDDERRAGSRAWDRDDDDEYDDDDDRSYDRRSRRRITENREADAAFGGEAEDDRHGVPWASGQIERLARSAIRTRSTPPNTRP